MGSVPNFLQETTLKAGNFSGLCITMPPRVFQ